MQIRLANNKFLFTVAALAHQERVVAKQQHCNGTVPLIGQQFNALGRAQLFKLLQKDADDRVDINQGHLFLLIMAGDDPCADDIGVCLDPVNHLLRNRGLHINDIIADEAVALIHIARDVYVVGT